MRSSARLKMVSTKIPPDSQIGVGVSLSADGEPLSGCPERSQWPRPPSLGLSGQFTFSPSPATGPERFQFCVGEPLGAPAGAVHIKKSPSSGPSGPPTPFVPPGHFPLIGGIVLPPWRGKACGRLIAAPTKGTETRFRIHLGRPQGSPLRRIQHRECWFGKVRRKIGTAPIAIFANPGPSGPAGI